jgi:O-antigen/teichoic acid export membrane protein
MVHFGSWIAAASVLGCLLLYFDQWILSFLLGIGLLPFYTVPMNLLNRLSIFPSSLTQTLFPAFSALNAKSEWTRIDDYFVRSHRYLLTIMIPICFVLFVWGPEILRLWLGTSFASHAGLALKILSVGMLIGLLAPLSGSLLEAVGRPDVLVKLYLLELPFNVALVWFLTKHFGITGAAFSFVIRTILETIVLWIAVYRISPSSGVRFLNAGLLRAGLWSGAFGLLAYFMPAAAIRSVANITVTLLALAAYCLSVRFYIFDEKDRAFAVDFCRAKTNKLLRPKGAEILSIGFSKTADFVQAKRESEASGD